VRPDHHGRGLASGLWAHDPASAHFSEGEGMRPSEPNTLLPGIILVTCLVALFLAYRTLAVMEARACQAISQGH
jgi:hypothetical protein